ncbi:MAG TPA: Tol-Pal system beta propeller repeat protein TolB [Candidatus Polarisedimenticolaceae bacterium]|nr:Tol-Pal system beta propeller repeat protein TolB [Candidatus Polarisedimenticolaceae bacterium]
MIGRRIAFPAIALAFLLVPAGAGSAAQDRPRLDVELSAGMQPIRIAVPAPLADRAEDENAAELVLTLRADLEFSGYFDVVDPSLYRRVPPPAGDDEPVEDWLSIGAQAVARLRLRSSGERIDVEARLFDTEGGGLLFARRYGGSTELVRRVAHTVADDLIEFYAGEGAGIATTRISFVSTHGDDKEVYLMDYDGSRIRRLTTTNTINLTPAWSPDGNELAYVSWRGRQPAVYVMSSDGKLGELGIVASELSSAPDWSPDGRRLVYSADVEGNVELFVLDRLSGRNTRLTRHAAIETSPAYSPNGREIAFTSDRAGVPQIYLMDAEGVNVRRVSWTGDYNDSAAWSPSGDRLAYASRVDGFFQIVVLDLSTEQVTPLTAARAHNENPRWSPDGRHIVFASNRGGNYQIYTMRANGAEVRQLTRGRESVTPDWSR